MTIFKSPRACWQLWLVGVLFCVALWIVPVNFRITRAASLVLASVVWFGLIGLVWRMSLVRTILLVITLAAGVFLSLPARGSQSVEALRGSYIGGLRYYEGIQYYWGGENCRGIDCSGLVRRGMIDALFWRGVQTLDPGFVRQAIGLWWHDCTASALGEQYLGLTTRLLDAPSINAVDHSKILPGDVAVTTNGVHIMAYLGDQSWIEADPVAGRVITVKVPSTDNSWFHVPVNILRWSNLR